MPVVTTEGSTMAGHVKLRRPRTQLAQSVLEDAPNPPHPEAPIIVQSSIACKPSNIGGAIVAARKKNNFSPSTFRGLGCTAATPAQVSVPAAIRASADWERKSARKTKKKKKQQQRGEIDASGGISCMVVEDVWCGPGIGFSAEAASVDCVVARRNIASSSSTVRGKIDGEQLNQREHSSCLARRPANPDTLSYLDSESALVPTRPASSDVLRRRYYRHARHLSPEGLAEIVLFRNSLQNGGRSDSHDRFSNWRLDVDGMTYEELVELGERIGYVSTGLKEDEIVDCVTKSKILVDQKTSHLNRHLAAPQLDWKCSICQEECEADEEMGKLECGHIYHLQCIKQWLELKNSCPVCKIAAKC